MTDRHVGVLAVGVWAAAFHPVGGSSLLVLFVAVLVVVLWRLRRPMALVAALVLLSAVSSGAAWARINPVETRSFEGEAVLVADPQPVNGGVRVAADIEGERYDLRAWGAPAGWLRNRLMGESVRIEANLRPLADAPTWLLAQGVVGRGTVTAVDSFQVGAPHTRLANSIRRTIESGAASLSRDERALFAGLVYGDDRQQSPLTADNFDAAGLTHLLAVSGQNVAFALAIVGPLLRRLGHRQRFVFVLVVLLIFATVTRFEPSVIRASVMTGVAAVASLVGTEVSSRRILGLAIALLILVDPLIVHSVAFQLSVAASAGILLWSGRVARALPGPRVIVESLAVTATAQLAVAPLLVWRFDGLPVASLPANLLVGAVAGPVMMWGLTAGLFAGLVPSWLAVVLHHPTKVALWWIDSVAATAPDVPLGQLGGPHIGLLFVFGAFGLRQSGQLGRVAAGAAIVAVLLHPAISLATASPQSQPIDSRSFIWRDDDTTIVELDSASRPQEVLAALRLANVGDIDLLIAHQSSFGNAALIRWIRSHHNIDHVWAPQQTMGVGEVAPRHGISALVDEATLTIDASDTRLTVVADPAQ